MERHRPKSLKRWVAEMVPPSPPTFWTGQIIAVASAAAGASIRFLLEPWLQGGLPFLFFFPAVLIASVWGGTSAGVTALVLSAAAANYFWMAPVWRFNWNRPEAIGVMAFGVAGGVIIFMSAVFRYLVNTHREAQKRILANEARFETFAQAMPNQVWSATPDGQLDWISNQVFDYSGFRFDELSGSQWGKIVHPDDLDDVTNTWAAALKNGGAYQTEFRLRRFDGAFRWHLVRALPIRDAAGQIIKWIGSNTDIEYTRAITAELEDSRQRMTAALAAADIGIWDFDPRSGDLKWDNRCYELFGLPPGQPVSLEIFLAGLHPLDRQATERACREALSPEGTGLYDIEYRTIGLCDGVERWCSARGMSYFENDVAVRFIGTIRDISKLKNAETQQELLKHELEHRIKNIMAMINAIVSQTFRTTSTKQEAQAVLNGRLAAFQQAHALLVQSSWTAADLGGVVESALAPHRSGEGRFNIQGPKVTLSPRQAMSLALALHELATNATKYGALSAPGGTVDVIWTFGSPVGTPELTFCWRESGGPEVRPPSHQGFGTRLIERTLAADFEATVELEYARSGLICRFVTHPNNVASQKT